jgi:hypothetical protein
MTCDGAVHGGQHGDVIADHVQRLVRLQGERDAQRTTARALAPAMVVDCRAAFHKERLA